MLLIFLVPKLRSVAQNEWKKYPLQATEALCHLSVTYIKKPFCNVWFFCKNEACVNCGTLNATTLIWLLLSPPLSCTGDNNSKRPKARLHVFQNTFGKKNYKYDFMIETDKETTKKYIVSILKKHIP